MDGVIRGLAVYFFLLIVFRLNGKRSLSQITMFDFVMLLIISETTQQALLADDFSVTNAFILILTLMTADILLSFVKSKSKKLEKILDGVPLIILEDGKLIEERANNSRVDEEDILESARKIHGISRLDEIKYAILEKDGNISVIPIGDETKSKTKKS